MPKYMIHSSSQRKWYVQEYLIPSLLAQKIDRKDILLYVDENNEGCLKSSIRSFKIAAEEEVDGIWHLQDDVLVCRDFKKRTEQYDDGLVCGFASSYDKNPKVGKVTGIDNIWYSFPCIRIPTFILKHYVIWLNSYLITDNRYKSWVKSNKHDDLLFRYFLDHYYKSLEALNLAPNLVQHVDWLLGGSIVNQSREKDASSLYWEDDELVEKLEGELNESRNNIK